SYHQRTGGDWCIYPMYDYAHPLSDALEGITHSVCTLEFENHRPLYDWVLDNLDVPCRSRQIEFARLNITHTVMSKRKLRCLVEKGHVSGWDDPRMPTLAGLRRRGYTPSAIRSFCEKIGVAKADSTVEIGLLEHCIREDLNAAVKRVMAVLRPLKLTLTNYPQGQKELLPADNNPENPAEGQREMPFSRSLYIERDDFMEEPPKGFHRLSPGGEVRLKHAFIIKCEQVIKDEAGNVAELLCTYDPLSKSGADQSGKKVKGTIHWVEAESAADLEIRLYDHLLSGEDAEGDDLAGRLNPASLVVERGKGEAWLAGTPTGARYQFLRQGYFIKDADSGAQRPVFNRIVPLKDSWAKLQGK
ncbi:MAG: glutamate--tRNA ligase family protein, partial [Clostridiales bacterium]|nr:glutamate--tRNA ligase family protein [Clostridiales bacterium]